jgi:sterol desaturase/sphingolipid hydroxylase (fatty acid hydroxylase superfamily)
MADAVTAVEPILRVGAFAGVFVAVALWEVLAPRRTLRFSRTQRWPHNLGLVALNVLIVRLLVPGAAIEVAVAGDSQGWGLFNAVALPAWSEILLAVVLLDLAIYLQHVLFHAVPMLWRLHRVHHADPDYDVTTGLRFHPVETLLSLGIKGAVIAALGAPVIAVLAFEVTLNAAAMFNHANGRLPVAVDRFMRWLVVTPDMHRVHHSVVPQEMNSNFGFNLPWWDRLFRTYRAQPQAGHTAMGIGVEGLQAPEELKLARLLTQPLRDVRSANPTEGRPNDAVDPPLIVRKEHV